jgi:NitT/TauT family transport system permease protein/sulfonate transport system permease protein
MATPPETELVPTSTKSTGTARHHRRDTARSVVFRPKAVDRNPTRYRKRRRRVEVTLAILVPIALLGLWELAADANWIDVRYFPAPSTIWDAGVRLVNNGLLQHDLWISVRRMLLGFFFGCTIGIVFAVALAQSRLVRKALEPLVYALWAVPKLALLPLLLLIFGIGESPMVILIAITCFFLVFIPTLAAMIAVPFPYREAATSFNASRWQMLRYVTFPAALPQIFLALRLTAGAAVLTLVAVEFVESSSGLGYLIWNSWSLFQADQMYVGIIVVAILGALFTLLVVAIGHKVCPWAREG